MIPRPSVAASAFLGCLIATGCASQLVDNTGAPPPHPGADASSGAVDAGIGPDAGPRDAGAPPPDAGAADAAAGDAGAPSPDAGALDAGAGDAGWVDPGSNCYVPQLGDAWIIDAGIPELWHEVNDAMTWVQGAYPDRFNGNQIVGALDPDPTVAEAARQWFFGTVAQRLRDTHRCAGQYEDGVADEIEVGAQCAGPFEGYHVINYGGGSIIWAQPSAVPCSWEATPQYPKCPGAGRGDGWPTVPAACAR
jgi:hypothetical protein